MLLFYKYEFYNGNLIIIKFIHKYKYILIFNKQFSNNVALLISILPLIY